MINFASSPPPPSIAPTFTVVVDCNSDFGTTCIIPLNLTSTSNSVLIGFDRKMVRQKKRLSLCLLKCETQNLIYSCPPQFSLLFPPLHESILDLTSRHLRADAAPGSRAKNHVRASRDRLEGCTVVEFCERLRLWPRAASRSVSPSLCFARFCL